MSTGFLFPPLGPKTYLQLFSEGDMHSTSFFSFLFFFFLSFFLSFLLLVSAVFFIFLFQALLCLCVCLCPSACLSSMQVNVCLEGESFLNLECQKENSRKNDFSTIINGFASLSLSHIHTNTPVISLSLHSISFPLHMSMVGVLY